MRLLGEIEANTRATSVSVGSGSIFGDPTTLAQALALIGGGDKSSLVKDDDWYRANGYEWDEYQKAWRKPASTSAGGTDVGFGAIPTDYWGRPIEDPWSQMSGSGVPGGYFAEGGITSGPTTGYPIIAHGTEAIVPLPDGKSIPVEIVGGSNGISIQTINIVLPAGASSNSGIKKAVSEGVYQALRSAKGKAITQRSAARR